MHRKSLFIYLSGTDVIDKDNIYYYFYIFMKIENNNFNKCVKFLKDDFLSDASGNIFFLL